MPFTFSHPAIILPLLSKKYNKLFSSTGLIVGSMAPDFESFIRFGDDKVHGHKWSGVLWFDLPLGLFVAFLFHMVVRDSLIQNLPKSLRARFEFARNFNWLAYFKSHVFIVITSLLLGILSHLLWDAFTHLNIVYPDSRRSDIRLGMFRIFILLQYITSLIGLIVVLWYVYKLPKMQIKEIKWDKIKYWIYVLLIAVMSAAFVLTSNAYEEDGINFLYTTNVCIASFLLALTVVSCVEKMVSKPFVKS